MINKIAIIFTAVIVLIIALLMWIAFHYYGKSVAQADSLATAVQQKNEAEFITKSQALSVGILNQIAGATLDVQKANVSASQDRQVIIKTMLKADTCAVQPVPAAAAGSLLEHYNAIRKGTSNADTGQPAGAVRAIPAT
ncbi:hypothetical protein LLR08_21930 [Rouxiella badensis]|uniref:hypothetical protein n=1 Tax=Rouxiella badensis TaxID=1646377 RepID=UPI001D156146|nr:hypothetical protein [Rouxiella badensis]MCC3705213.1 hypothetical protein [Rouxiella badensis]